MSTRVHKSIRWLQRRGSLPLLAAIGITTAVSVWLIDDGGPARPWTIGAMAVLGVALVLGCLFAFPYAGIWHDDAYYTSPGPVETVEPAATEVSAEDRRKFVNEIRTMLISIVSAWDADKRKRWEVTVAGKPRGAEEDPRVGVGSLRKRAPDVQSALSIVSSIKQRPPGFKPDFRDADLQGAVLSGAKLQQALFSGTHLDYLDTRISKGP
jgi:hypothetical protein